MEEGGSFFLLRIFERFKDSLRSVFLGKECAFRLLSYIEDLMSNSCPENFARTFRDGNKIFIGMVIRFSFYKWDSMHMEAF